jgi:hypothetical protein
MIPDSGHVTADSDYPAKSGFETHSGYLSSDGEYVLADGSGYESSIG